MYINQRNCVTLCFEPRPCWLGILEAQTFVAWALQLRCRVAGSDRDPWVPPGLQPPRVRSECLLWILEAFKAFGSFLLPSHSHISFRGTEFTQLHFFVVVFWVFSSSFKSVVWRFASSWSTIWMGQDRETQLPLKKTLENSPNLNV